MAPITAPTTEIGYTQTPNYNWWLYENETTPELIWPMSVYVYDQMRRQDAQVGSVLRAVTETLLRTPWRIDPAGARARVVKFVADDLGLPVVGKQPTAPPRLKDRFSWPTHLREALLMLPMGHSYFEQVYRVAADGSAAHLRKLAYRPAKTIERIDVAPDGGLIAIKQWWTTADRRPEPIPVNRLVAYIHAKEGGNWLGTSILRNCYKNWLLKDRLLRVQAQTIERNGMGIPLYTANESETDLSAGLSMATKWRAGEAAGSAIPFGASLKLVGVEGTLPDAEPAIRYHDEQIARAVLAHFLNLGTQTGSWALGSTFADFFVMSLQTLAEQIRDTATSHIIEDLVDINFGENEPAPRLVFDEIGSRQAATAAALKTLVDAGVIRPDEVLEESSRQQYGLPPADPSTVRTPPAPAAPDMLPAPTETGDLSTAVAASADPKAGAVEDADLDEEAGPDSDEVAAAGPAHTPSGFKGAHRLQEYWTRGEGLTKWASSAHPWTELYHHLLKYIPNENEAKATAAAWYHDVFGTWPGHHDGGHGVKAKFNPSEPRIPGGEHGGEWGHGGSAGKELKKAGKALEGQDALDAAPAKLTRAPGGHSGNYTGEKLSGPKGIGSARALSEYQGLEYGTTNGILRHPGSDAEETDWGKETLARIADIDKTMAASPLEHDVQVHRIVQHGSATFGRDVWYGHVIDWNSDDFDKQDREAENWEAGARPDLTGLRWSDAAYSSTTVDPKAAEAFGGRWRTSNSAIDGEPVIMSIHVPAGTGGVQLSEIGHEAEILLDRGLTMQVVADHGVGDDGFRRLDVEVVPSGNAS